MYVITLNSKYLLYDVEIDLTSRDLPCFYLTSIFSIAFTICGIGQNYLAKMGDIGVDTTHTHEESGLFYLGGTHLNM